MGMREFLMSRNLNTVFPFSGIIMWHAEFHIDCVDVIDPTVWQYDEHALVTLDGEAGFL